MLLRHGPRFGSQHRQALAGLMKTTTIWPLRSANCSHSPRWRRGNVARRLVSSRMIDRVVQKTGRQLCEVPVGQVVLAPGL